MRVPPLLLAFSSLGERCTELRAFLHFRDSVRQRQERALCSAPSVCTHSFCSDSVAQPLSVLHRAAELQEHD